MADNDHNEDWSFETNLAGVEPATGGSRQDVNHKDYYKGKVIKMFTKSEKPQRVLILVEIAEGQYTGSTVLGGLNMPKSAEDKVRYYWRAFAESAGHEPAALDKGDITLNKDAFLGRTVHFFYTPKTLSTTGYDSVDFLPPAEWATRKEGFTPVAGPTPAAAGNGGGGAATGGSGGAATLGGASTLDSNDVKAKLGL